MKVTQVELQYVGDRLVCWLPGQASEFKKGMRVTLQGSPRIWTVGEVYSTQEHYAINRKWDVGGL